MQEGEIRLRNLDPRDIKEKEKIEAPPYVLHSRGFFFLSSQHYDKETSGDL